MKDGGLISWNAIATFEMSKTSWQVGRLLMKDGLENHLKDQQFLLEQRLVITRQPKDQARIHQFDKKVLPGIFLGYELIAVEVWKGDILIADLEDLEKLNASEIYHRRIKGKEVLISQKRDEFIFPIADGTAKLSG